MQEVWKPVPEYEKWYEVSDLGRIKVLPYEVATSRNGKPRVLHRSERIVDPGIAASEGYRMVQLTNRESGRSDRVRICDIVAKVFDGLEPGTYDRINDDLLDDRACNFISKFASLDTPDRVWKPVPGYEGLYEISNLGEVKSLGRFVNHKSHRRVRKTAKLLKYSVDEDGYFGVALSDINGVAKQHRVNRLVALTFIPNPENLSVVNHKNGDKQDNRVENLEWCTVKYNTFEAYRMGLNDASKPIPVVCLDNNREFESVHAAAVWVGCDHGNITESMNQHSCCKYGWCFVRQSDYPDDLRSYLAEAKKLYYSKPNRYRIEIKCLDTGEVFPNVRQCAGKFNKSGDFLSERIRTHRLFQGQCYARVEDIKVNQWDEADYCKWVHDLEDARSSHNKMREHHLKEYGKQTFYLEERSLTWP